LRSPQAQVALSEEHAMSTSQEVMANPFTGLELGRLYQRTCAKWAVYPDDVLPLWVAEMDAYVAQPIVDAVHEALVMGDTGYPFGPRYANAYGSFASDRWGWTVDPALTTNVTDVMTGVRETLAAISDEKTRVVVTPPVYPPFFGVANTLARQIVTAPLDVEGRLDPSTLEAAFKEATADGHSAVMILCNPHNPTGTVHTRAELEMVANMARQYGARVISDEIHSPLIMPTSTFTPYLSVPNTAQDFAVASASKGWNLAGFKAAIVVAGAEAAEDLQSPVIRGGGHAGHIAIIAHSTAFNSARDWLDGALSGIDTNRTLLADLLETHLPETVYRVPEGTYLAWIDCRALDLGDDPAAVFLEKTKVALSSGTGFGEEGKGHVRLDLATSPEILEEAVQRMAKVRN
jgi:cystathionine beta-lyase